MNLGKFNPLKEKLSQKLSELFSFEKGVDITNDTQVLYRKNLVIKNIIFLSNWAYTIILFLISLGDSNTSNWVLTICFVPFNFILNKTLKSIIHSDPSSYLKQQIAMYMISFYMFLSAILVYFKLKSGVDVSYLNEAGYMLIYYSLIVVSLYQDKKLMKMIYPWLIAIVTVLHFTLTYQIYKMDYATDKVKFFQQFFTSSEFRDIALRTFILLLMMVGIYIGVSFSDYLLKQRKEELMKRVDIQDGFTEVVSDLFDVLLESNQTSIDRDQVKIEAVFTKKLAGLLGFRPDKCEDIYKYTLMLLDIKNLSIRENVMKAQQSEYDFMELRKKSKMGSELVKRLQLYQKGETIIKAHMDGIADKAFRDQQKEIQNTEEGQVILLCDIYVALRKEKYYKKPYSHQATMKVLEQEFKEYFDYKIYDRFIRYEHDFESLYYEQTL